VSSLASIERAAHNILARSLGLRRDQQLLVFADSASLPVADAITQSSRQLNVSVSVIYVPLSAQSDLGPSETLPLPVESAIREADAVLSCLSDQPSDIGYRMRVLRSAWNRRTKLAHSPGMNLSIMRAADTDYGLIADRCQQLAQALILGRSLEVTTEDARGQRFRLRVMIDGLNYPPGISDGVISNGAWANLPPGETYVIPCDAHGQIAINGSIPGRLLVAGETLVLTFKDGRLTDMEPRESHVVRHLMQTQIAFAEARGDPNWANLAEVGFGVNPAVKRLTGAPLLDTKTSHTVHIALGHSASLGGDVESAIHCDLTARDPSVTLDEKPILDKGQWRLNVTDWRLDMGSAEAPAIWQHSVSQVQRTGLRVARDNPQGTPGTGRLLYTWNDGRGRWNTIPVGSDATARLAARVYDLVPEGGTAIGLPDLIREAGAAGIETEQALRVLWVLRRFDILRTPRDNEK
jgi:leucyl aminopeptidase (aminopeptidase T)